MQPSAVRSRVSLIDDDPSVREALPSLLEDHGFAVRAFASAEEFLASDGLDGSDCLILDVSMPGMTGPELQRELVRRRVVTPIVFITAEADEAVRRRVIADGAVACILKPFTESALLAALDAALRAR